MPVRILRRTFNVDEYHRMARAGILSEDDRVELLEGEITEMSPIGSRHQGCVDRLARLLFGFAGHDYILRVQGPILLDHHSEPQPDLALLKPRPDFYAGAHPSPEDVLLLVEVSETSAEYDRTVKLPLYAGHGLREVWIVDLGAGTVEVHTDLSPEGYGTVASSRRGETVSSRSVPGLSLTAEDILG